MDLNKYQQHARSTAIYPNEYSIIYPALGLAGEAGETCEKVKKLIRDSDFVLTEEFKDTIKKELGDVMWYIANLAMDCGLSLEEIAEGNLNKLRSRAERGKLKGSGDNR